MLPRALISTWCSGVRMRTPVGTRAGGGGQVLRAARSSDRRGSRRFSRLGAGERPDGSFDHPPAGRLAHAAGQGGVLVVAVDAPFLQAGAPPPNLPAQI